LEIGVSGWTLTKLLKVLMRTIHKGNHPPYHLEQRRLKGTPINPEKAWQNFSHKEEVRNFLKPKQYCLCAYCESRLDELGEHIEHVMPKSKNNFTSRMLSLLRDSIRNFDL
jgi:DNA topoisomerase VI subunit A